MEGSGVGWTDIEGEDIAVGAIANFGPRDMIVIAQAIVIMAIVLIHELDALRGTARIIIVVLEVVARGGHKLIARLRCHHITGIRASRLRSGGALRDVELIDKQATALTRHATAGFRGWIIVIARLPAALGEHAIVVPRAINRIAIGGEAIDGGVPCAGVVQLLGQADRMGVVMVVPHSRMTRADIEIVKLEVEGLVHPNALAVVRLTILPVEYRNAVDPCANAAQSTFTGFCGGFRL